MMFSNLFKAKWQHKDANVRILAIQSFNIQEPENITILNTLINRDESELVRRTALLKLNQFSVFLEQANSNSHNKIRTLANEQLQQLVLKNKVSDAEKRLLLAQYERVSFFEQWLQVEQDVELIKILLSKINKPNSLSQFILKSNNQVLQEEVLNRIDDIALLEKVVKKLADGPVKALTQTKLHYLQELLEKPLKLQKLSQLLLSKLLALKELHDYADMQARRLDIEAKWTNAVLPALDCLAEQEQKVITDKFDKISLKLKDHFAAREEAYQHQQFIEKQNAQHQQHLLDYNNAIKNVSLQISDAVFENVELDQFTVSRELDQLINGLKHSLLSAQEQLEFKQKIEQLHVKLNKLPEVAQCVSSATSLISQLSTLTLPTSIKELNLRQPIFDDWQHQWRDINALANDILPVSIISARDEIERQWQQAMTPLIKEQSVQFKLVARKIAELKRLINTGKYKSAFGLHKKLTFMIVDLSKAHQERIATDFETVSEQIDQLHELESFVVTPRKQELLVELKALVELPLDNPSIQAAKVKEFRKRWTNLGHADGEIDKQLNLDFNLLIEQAFAPCREFYAEQSKIRQRHLQDKLAILDRFNALKNEISQPSVDFQQLDTRLHKLLIQWRKSGEVDRAEYQKLQSKFKESLEPIKSAINEYHKDNAQKKVEIIEQAKKQLENEDLYDAIERLKVMQQQWRKIGHVGGKKENTLWLQFRKINDQIFEKRSQAKADLQTQMSERMFDFDERLKAVEQSIADVNSSQSINQAILAAEAIIVEIKEFDPVIKKSLIKAEQLLKSLQNKMSLVNKNKGKQTLKNLFTIFEASISLPLEDIKEHDSFSGLPKRWQKTIISAYKATPQTNKLNREQLTLELEILANVESPNELATQRLETQMNMLSAKLMQGDIDNLEQRLQQWLSLGIMSAGESEILERVKRIFI